MDQGTRLDKDQLDAVQKLSDVSLQLELVKDLQKQFATLNTEVASGNTVTRTHYYSTSRG